MWIKLEYNFLRRERWYFSKASLINSDVKWFDSKLSDVASMSIIMLFLTKMKVYFRAFKHGINRNTLLTLSEPFMKILWKIG